MTDPKRKTAIVTGGSGGIGSAVARRLGMTPETMRKWIRQAAVDEGQAPGVTTEASKEVRELKRKVSELEATLQNKVILRRVAGP